MYVRLIDEGTARYTEHSLSEKEEKEKRGTV